ncbi:hypothetical protein M3D57_09195 [Corynebacterium sanguinis]|nr:hypothetical protein [Corynebacterium sanguinis]MCT1414295.1 hypothetical protein [Corynebacterium sanguinis]MCT1585290.1 hypothetical protein [Corynebacterium sanguinis]MCT1663525.1 hypothetical protein [Corynebacterium sanguinis]MCT2023864.1 hypothetical protein [Corynebacterium sanguinis]MCT2047669.1 hypothetical protein [Corynebacterium sanguinis]
MCPLVNELFLQTPAEFNRERIARFSPVFRDLVGRAQTGVVLREERGELLRSGEHGGYLVEGFNVSHTEYPHVARLIDPGGVEGVDDVLRVLAVQADRPHAHGGRELHYLLDNAVVGVGSRHDLHHVGDVDVVGEVVGEELVRAPRGVLEVAGQQSRGVGQQNGLLGQEIGELGVGVFLDVQVLRYSFDDVVGIPCGFFQRGGVRDLIDDRLGLILGDIVEVAYVVAGDLLYALVGGADGVVANVKGRHRVPVKGGAVGDLGAEVTGAED